MNDKTQYFFDRIAIRERYFIIVSQSLKQEIKLRKGEGEVFNDNELDQLFNVDQDFLNKHKQELATIIKLVDDLNSFERSATAIRDASSDEKIVRLKSRLKTILDMTDVETIKPYSRKMAQQLLNDYNDELQKIVNIVNELQKLKTKSEKSGQLQNQLKNLEAEIGKMLAVDGKTVDPVVENYVEELIKIVELFRQLDELDLRTSTDNFDVHQKISRIKENVVSVIDEDLLNSIGYKQIEFATEKERLDTYFDEWKARQILYFRTKEKQIELLKKRLISSATNLQLKRLFDAEVVQAIFEFNESNFEVAELLFKDILGYYPYSQVDDISYFLAECYFVQKKYAYAEDLYLKIVDNKKDQEYISKSYWRLMLISDSFKRYRDFFTFAQEVLKMYKSRPSDVFLEKMIFYSGYVAFNIKNFKNSLVLLRQLSKNTSFYLPGQFLTAVNYLNLNQPEKAKPILTLLGKEKTYKDKTDVSIALRNLAYLKTGLIYYDDNDLSSALNSLENVSSDVPGSDIKSLSRAWSLFRLGYLEKAVNELDLFFWNHLSSNYIYEAMMLSAHCNRLLGNIKSSTRKVRYVENAEKTLQINNELNLERQKINNILSEINKLEEPVILSGDVYAYQKLEKLRADLENSLQSMEYQGNPGLQLIQDYEEEQQHIEKLIADLNDLHKIAEILGREELKIDINQAIPKLKSKLTEIQRFQRGQRIDILADYPVAKKESDIKFQKMTLGKMRNDVELEQRKLEFYKEEIVSLLKKAEQSQNSEAINQLNYRDLELAELKNRLEVFMVILSENEVTMMDTDYRKWSNFSGFGMSDLDFVRMKSLNRNIQKNSDFISLINSTLRQKEKGILRNLAVMDGKITDLEQSVYRENIEKIKSERERYFAEDYFISQISESDKDPDQVLKMLLEKKGQTVPDTTKIK